jgi:hypothetical protein
VTGERVIRESDVVHRRDVDGELLFAHDGKVDPDEIVLYKGVPYRIENAELLDTEGVAGDPVARAYPAPVEPIVQDPTLGDADVSKMRVDPGDVVVVTSPVPLSASQRAALRDQAAAVFPDNTVVVLEGGVTLGKVQTS